MSAAADICEAATELRLAQSQLEGLQKEFNFAGVRLVEAEAVWHKLEEIDQKIVSALFKLEA